MISAFLDWLLPHRVEMRKTERAIDILCDAFTYGAAWVGADGKVHHRGDGTPEPDWEQAA